MQQTWMAAGLALVMAMPAAAQERPRERERDVARAYALSFNRGRIGVIVKVEPDSETDRLGAKIDAITPGGPADKAGLRAGDIITRFNNVALGSRNVGPQGEASPGDRLVELARALDPGDTVQIEYRRGNDTRRATLMAENMPTVWTGQIGPLHIEPDFRFDVRPDVQVFTEPGFAFAFGEPWGGVDFVKMNAELGEYFGTSDGLLVTRTPSDSTLGLKGGDVILTIDGRTPTSASHAMRILRSYAEGETVRFDVMRRRNRTTVTWTVPDREARVRRLLPRREREREPA